MPVNPANEVILPGTGQPVAVDANNAGNLAYQRMKPVTGTEGVYNNVALGQALPVQDDTVLLRKILNILQSMGTIDSAQRQKVTIDAIGNGVTSTNTAGAIPVTVSSGTVTTVSTLTNQTNFGGGAAEEMWINYARMTYNTGIRDKLIFS